MTRPVKVRHVHNNQVKNEQRVGKMYESGFDKACLEGADERRSGGDRRNHSMMTLVYGLHGRRSLGRRQEDQVDCLVDRHEPRFLAIIMSIFVLCCLDAFFTLNLIASGIATEANPVMRWVMKESITLFWIFKLVLTSAAMMILLTLKNFYFIRMIKVGYLLYVTLAMYLLLIKYELWLFNLG
jgi:hypothetical protein